ncbi:MAG: hypothetical protein WCI05_07350 [Myxococcales bacterium]
MLDCGLCGFSFARDEAASCHRGCPMARGCGLVSCPSCGYEFPAESKLVALVTKLGKKLVNR